MSQTSQTPARDGGRQGVSDSKERPANSEIAVTAQAPLPHPLADLAAQIRQAAGVHRFNIRNAQRACVHCAMCGCTLSAESPIWRQPLYLGPGFFGGHSYTVAPVCERCRADRREFRGAKSCENCARPVHQELNFRSHRRTFCCRTCEATVRIAEQKQQRSDARGTRQCETCGETFEPTRADARFCSSPCRQRAYRRRVTAVCCLSGRTSNSRNAEPPPPDRTVPSSNGQGGRP
jgi:hypothetical protein